MLDAVLGNVGTIICFRVGATDAEVLVKEFTPYFTEEDLVNLAKWQVYLKLMIDGVASTPFSANILPPVKINYGNRDKIIRVSRERYAKDRKTIEDKISRWASSLEAAGIEEQRMISSQPPRVMRFDGAGTQRSAGPLRPSPAFATTSSPATMAPRPGLTAPSSSSTKPHEESSGSSNFKVLETPQKATTSRSTSVAGTSSPRKLTKPHVAISRSTPSAGNRPTSSANSPYKYEATCAMCKKNIYVSFPPDGQRPVYCRDCLRLVRSERNQMPEVTASQSDKVDLLPRQSSPLIRPDNGADVTPGQSVVL